MNLYVLYNIYMLSYSYLNHYFRYLEAKDREVTGIRRNYIPTYIA